MNSVVHKSCSAASIPESSRLPGHWVDSGSVLFYLPFRAVQGEDSHSGRRRCELLGTGRGVLAEPGKGPRNPSVSV